MDALTVVQPLFPDLPLRPLVERSIKDSLNKRHFEKIVRLINTDIKDDGAVNITTITELNRFIKGLQKVKHEETREVFN